MRLILETLWYLYSHDSGVHILSSLTLLVHKRWIWHCFGNLVNTPSAEYIQMHFLESRFLCFDQQFDNIWFKDPGNEHWFRLWCQKSDKLLPESTKHLVYLSPWSNCHNLTHSPDANTSHVKMSYLFFVCVKYLMILNDILVGLRCVP